MNSLDSIAFCATSFDPCRFNAVLDTLLFVVCLVATPHFRIDSWLLNLVSNRHPFMTESLKVRIATFFLVLLFNFVISFPMEVYSTTGCKFCRAAKAKLGDLGVVFTNFDINESDMDTLSERCLGRVAHAKKRTVPQIYIDDFHVGGAKELFDFADSGVLFQKLASANIGYCLDGPRVSSAAAAAAAAVGEFPPIQRPAAGNPLNSVDEVSDGDGAESHVEWAPSFSEIKAFEENPLSLSRALQRAALGLTDNFATADGLKVNYAGTIDTTWDKKTKRIIS